MTTELCNHVEWSLSTMSWQHRGVSLGKKAAYWSPRGLWDDIFLVVSQRSWFWTSVGRVRPQTRPSECMPEMHIQWNTHMRWTCKPKCQCIHFKMGTTLSGKIQVTCVSFRYHTPVPMDIYLENWISHRDHCCVNMELREVDCLEDYFTKAMMRPWPRIALNPWSNIILWVIIPI